MKRKIKILLSWVVVLCASLLCINIAYEFIKHFNEPWAYFLVFGSASYLLYKGIGE